MNTAARPIGIFDSGVGGLSVWREIQRLLPAESTVYLADQAHIPYGPRPALELEAFAEAIARFMLEQDCKLVVVACNTASAAALQTLRARFPATPFVGMEPAVKPAAAKTRRGVVAVMGTPGTLQGRLFAQTAERYAQGVEVLPCPCPGLVEHVEAGLLDGPETEALLRRLLQPALERQADAFVLGCTHYPFLSAALRRVVGPEAEIVDPAPAVARQVARVLAERRLENGIGGRHRFVTTGNGAALTGALRRLLGIEQAVEEAVWREDACIQVKAAA